MRRGGLQGRLQFVQRAQRLSIHASGDELGAIRHRQGAKRVQPEGLGGVGRCGHTGFGQSGVRYEHPSARPVPPEISALLTIPRHFGRSAGRLRLKTLAGSAVELLDLHAGQHARLKTQQLALVGQGWVPAGGEMAALPATDGRCRTGGVGGNVGGHGQLAMQVVRQQGLAKAIQLKLDDGTHDRSRWPLSAVFFSREEPRIHVHVAHPEGEVKFWLTPSVHLARNVGLSAGQLRQAQAVVEAHLLEIQNAWNHHFGG